MICLFCGKPATANVKIVSTLGLYTKAVERAVDLCDHCRAMSKDNAWLKAQEKSLSDGFKELAKAVNASRNNVSRVPLDPDGDAAARFRARQGVSAPPLSPPADKPAGPAAQSAAAEGRAEPKSGPLIGQCEFCGIGYRSGDKKCCSCGAALPVTVPGKPSKKELERIEAESKAAAEAAAKRKAEEAARKAARRKKILKIAIPCLCAAAVAAVGILIGFGVAAARAEKGLFYEKYENGYALTRAGSNYSQTHAEIPSAYKGSPVIKIESEAFKDNDTLKSVNIPSSVKEIGSDAFNGCLKLKAVYIKEGCQSIEDGSFTGCPVTIYYSGPQSSWNTIQGAAGLDYIAAADRLKINIAAMDFTGNLFFLKYIDLDAFAAGANSLFDADTLSLPSSFEGKTVEGVIPEGFLNAHLKTVTIPDSVKWIHERAFKGCAAMETISLPGVLSISQSAFEGCSSLSKIFIRCRPADDNVFYDPAGNQYFAAAAEEYVY